MENSNSNNNQKKKIHAIVVALPLQGHVIPTVQLALKLASKGISISFINAENIHHRITTSAATGEDIFAGTGEIEYVTVSDGLPVEYDRSLNHDHWVAATMHCYPAHVEVAVNKILRSRPSDAYRCCLIADAYSPWASILARKYGLIHVAFWTEAAIVLDIYFHLYLLKHHGFPPGTHKDTIEYIPGIKSIKSTDLMSYLQEEEWTTISHKSIFECIEDAQRAHFIIGNVVQELEVGPISAIHSLVPFYAIGPLFPPHFAKCPVATSLWAESDCTQWLNSKPIGSVLYVSFGSYAHLSKEDLAKIANGIKLSDVNFLWVLRPDMVSSDDPDPVPVGFKEEIRGRGMIVTWTSQAEVLSNKSIGGFLTHCGWNSILESIWCEIPLLCFPLLTDQFTNRKLVVEEWKIGYNLCDENSTLTSEQVSKKIKDLVIGERRLEVKAKMKEVKQIVENARLAQGSSERNLDEFIKQLSL